MPWTCHICTFLNENDTFLACGACGSERESESSEYVLEGRASPEPAPSLESQTPRRPTRAAPKLVPPTSPLRESSSPRKQSDPLKPLYMELVETERTYVKELEAVVYVFLLPLKAKAQESTSAYLNESEVNSVFGNIAEMCRVNTELLKEFDDALKATPETDSLKRVEALCQCFLRYASHLKMYAIYAIQYDEAQAKLKRFEEERFRFAEFINSAGGMNEITMNQPLASFLIKPIQRICKYPLFFNSMIKIIKEDSPVYPVIRKTLDAASDVASRINADKLRAEQNLRAFEIAKRMESLADVVLEPGRRYIGEWKCLLSEGHSSLNQKRRSMTNKIIHTEKKVRSFFLFNDVLLVTKEFGTGNKLRYEIRLWMSMNQLQFGGVSAPVDAPKLVREASAEANAASNGENGTFKAKLFQLPLEILHVASTDRERCQIYRERQQQAKESQGAIQQITSRRSSLFRRKSQQQSSNVETVITAYTMWFRSGAERARVCGLLEKAISEFAGNTSSRVKSMFAPSNLVLSPLSPINDKGLPTSMSEEGQRFFANSEDSSPSAEESPRIAKSQSFDSSLHLRSTSLYRQPVTSAVNVATIPQQVRIEGVRIEGVPSEVEFSLDPLNLAIPKAEHRMVSLPRSQTTTSGNTSEPPSATSSSSQLSKQRTITRKGSSNRPRPPPPPPPATVASTNGSSRSGAPIGVTPPIRPPPKPMSTTTTSFVATATSAELSVLDGDTLISKWFGE